MSTLVYPDNLSRLSGLVAFDAFDTESFRRECRHLKQEGFVDAYLGSAFLRAVPPDWAGPADLVVFEEEDSLLVLRPESELTAIRQIADDEGVSIESAHYNQVLAPPGGAADPGWLMWYHGEMMRRAALLGLKRVTTHPGWMFGSSMEKYTGAPAKAYKAGRISLAELNQDAFMAYGGETKVWADSIDLYRDISAIAESEGITITIETAISEWYELTLSPERMISFIKEVGAPNLGICVDSGHCHLNSLDVADVISRCGPYFVETHFHDNYGKKDEHNPLGQGTIRWQKVLKAMVEASYQGIVTFEQTDHVKNAAFWKRLLDRSAPHHPAFPKPKPEK